MGVFQVAQVLGLGADPCGGLEPHFSGDLLRSDLGFHIGRFSFSCPYPLGQGTDLSLIARE